MQRTMRRLRALQPGEARPRGCWSLPSGTMSNKLPRGCWTPARLGRAGERLGAGKDLFRIHLLMQSGRQNTCPVYQISQKPKEKSERKCGTCRVMKF